MQPSSTIDSSGNLLMIVVDCLRLDRCPVDGAGTLGLKAWPRMRDGGTFFTQMVSSASWTPVCFASLLSGQYPFVHGVRSLRGPAIEPSLPTIATVLKDAGYSTHGFLTGPMLEVLGMNRGFDEYQHRERDVYVHDGWGNSFMKRFDEICQASRPWFVLLHLFEIHYPPQTNGLPAKKHSIRQYDLAWQQLDLWLADLLDRTPSNTLVSLTGDHAETVVRRSDRRIAGHVYRKLREHFKLPRRVSDWRRHGYHVFDDIIRIPWAVSGPSVPKDKVINQPVRQVDIAPTVLELLGHTMPPKTHGRSVAAMLRGETMPEEAAYIVSGTSDPRRDWHGLRKDGWKYAEHPRSGDNIDPEAMLFDLRNDPQERRNVISRNPSIALEMRQYIDRLIHSGSESEQAGQDLDDEDQAKLTDQLKALGYI